MNSEACRKYRAANLEKVRAKNRETAARRRAENPDKIRAIRRASWSKRYAEDRDNMLPKGRAKTAAYRSGLSQACPAWADRAHLDFIYANCPEGYHVDHIEPLKGKHASGLHVPCNLQYLPALVNISKGNRCVDVSTHAIIPPAYLKERLQFAIQ